MTLKQQLMVGIAVILTLFGIFFGIIWASNVGLKKFINIQLIPTMYAVEEYERFVIKWQNIGMTIGKARDARFFADRDEHLPLVSGEAVMGLENSLASLTKIIRVPERQKAFALICRLAQEYFELLQQFEQTLDKRRKLIRQEKHKVHVASQNVVSRTRELKDRFNNMYESVSALLKNKSLQDLAKNNTSELERNLSKIARDLDQIQSAIDNYSASLRGQRNLDPVAQGERGEQVYRRLNAVIGLLERQLGESVNPVQLRILRSILASVREFRVTFVGLRETIEKNDSDLIETDEFITELAGKLDAMLEQGINHSHRETSLYWNNIFDTSTQLIRKNEREFTFSVGLFLTGLAIGLGALVIYPRRVSQPLTEFATQLDEFTPGTPFPGTEHLETYEIQTLSRAFSGFFKRLDREIEMNSNIINAINGIGDSYSQLRNFPQYSESERIQSLREIIGDILQRIINGISGIDLVKVMILHQTGKDKKTLYFQRFGDSLNSQTFEQGSEFQTYSASLQTFLENGYETERVPFEEGITGWLHQGLGPDPKPDENAADKWNKTIRVSPIQSYETLTNRAYEKGLKGCAFHLPLRRELTSMYYGEEEKPEELGLLFLYSQNPQTKLSQQEMIFAQIMARQISLMIESTELIKVREEQKKTQMQLEMAAEIQAGLLPRTIPDIPFLRLSHLNKPAYEVGGDYYDFFQLDPDGERFGVVIADASGKNVPAAILMTVFKTTLATMDLANLSAGKVLTQSNLILKKMGIEDRFITAMYVIFHTSASTIEVACAGHNPGLLVSGRGYERSIAEISADGVPLGIIEMEYDSKTYKIKPNDLLLLYTDGVTEARNEQGDEFGISGLKKFLARPRGKVPAQDLYEDIKAHTQQAHQHDDITAVAVEFLGKKT